jgi:hypothetical protein
MTARALWRVVAAGCALAFCLPAARAESDDLPSGRAAGDDCSLVTKVEAGAILGYAVDAPDESSRRIGRCLFPTIVASQEGSVLYTVIRPEQLENIRRFYAFAAATCGGVMPGAPRENECKVFRKLATVADVDEYFADMTASANAVPVADVGDKAISTGDRLEIRSHDSVIEVTVMRGDEFELSRAVAVAQLLLPRLWPAPALH